MKRLWAILLFSIAGTCWAKLSIKPLGTDTLVLTNSVSDSELLELQFNKNDDIGKILLISYHYDAEKNKKLQKLEEYVTDRARVLIALDQNNYILQIRRIAGKDEHGWPVLRKASFAQVFKVGAVSGTSIDQKAFVGNLGMNISLKRWTIALLASILLAGSGGLLYAVFKD